MFSFVKKISSIIVLALVAFAALPVSVQADHNGREQDDCAPGFILNENHSGCIEANQETDPGGCSDLGSADAIERCLNQERNPDADAPAGGTSTLDGGPSGSLSATDLDIEQNPIFQRLEQIIQFLSIGVGIVATISVAIAGIQYTASRGDPGKTQAAVNRLIQVGIAVFLYIFGAVILNWLIPGGVL